MKRLMQTLVYRTVYGLLYAVSLIPMTILYTIASCLFLLVYYVTGYRKAVVIQNVARSFPRMKYGEVRAVVKQFYRQFSAYFAEIMKSLSAPAKSYENKIEFKNLSLIDEYIAEGHSVIACLGHCGNWEALNFMPYKLSYDTYAVYKPLRSRVINRLMIKLRSRFGMKLIADKMVVRHMLKNDSNPSIYLFLADQCPLRKEDNFDFSFLHQTTSFYPGMEKLAHKTNSAVLYLNVEQVAKGRYTVTCVPLCSNAIGLTEGVITQKYVELLTKNIEASPAGWLWTHKRWKR